MERKKNVAEIKRLLQEKRHLSHASHDLFRFLTLKGISNRFAEEITAEFETAQEELSSLHHILAKKIRVLKNPETISSKKLAFVGPKGVGKTTLILKLAHTYARQNKRVAVISLEKEKIKAQILKCYLYDLKEVTILEKWEPMSSFDAVLIDTCGCNFYEESQIDLLGELLSEGPESEIILTLSLTGKEEDLSAAIHQFSTLRPQGLCFTKIDETLTSGTLINLLAKTELPLYFASYGASWNEEIQVADPYKITHRILTDLNGEKYQQLRHINRQFL